MEFNRTSGGRSEVGPPQEAEEAGSSVLRVEVAGLEVTLNNTNAQGEKTFPCIDFLILSDSQERPEFETRNIYLEVVLIRRSFRSTVNSVISICRMRAFHPYFTQARIGALPERVRVSNDNLRSGENLKVGNYKMHSV